MHLHRRQCKNLGPVVQSSHPKRANCLPHQGCRVSESYFHGDLEERSFLSERRVAHLQEQRALREQKGMKAATNGLGERFPVGPAVFVEEFSVPSSPCHSGRMTVPSALPSEPIA